jgi:hypothetical protein
MKVPFEHYMIEVWYDAGGVLNYDLRLASDTHAVIAVGYDLSGTMDRTDAVRRCEAIAQAEMAHQRARSERFRANAA